MGCDLMRENRFGLWVSKTGVVMLRRARIIIQLVLFAMGMSD